MNFFDLDDKIVAAIIGAAGTMIGALIQLRVAWKKEQTARARGTPPTKKSRRGPVLAVFLLLLAAGVGGFALSQYLISRPEHEAAALRGELQVRLAQISATADRLEQAHLKSQRGAAEIEAQHVEVGVRTIEGIALASIGPCRQQPTAADGCTEEDATRITVCAGVPAGAAIIDVALYARPEDSDRAWTESRVQPGEEAGRARFAPIFERMEADRTKRVCTLFSSRDSERPQSARIVVSYTLPPAVQAVSHTATAADHAR